MSTEKELMIKTKRLLSYNEKALLRFEQAKESGEKGDFYKEVKPFADNVKEEAEIWRKEASDWLMKHPQRNLHTRQILSAAENIEMVSIQAFFPETSRKRFIGHIQSIEFVLNSFLKALERIIEDYA
ncbi:YppE family protein [Mesobacillus foraminis]|uniref:YppE family protein n=1 Tax=Mesobacillus foraminis TaxID=279826 RepID=UPI0039A349A6